MWARQRTGSVLCPSCRQLVGVNDAACLNCGRRNPGMMGLTAMLRGVAALEDSLGPMVMIACGILYIASAALTSTIAGEGGTFSRNRRSQQPGACGPGCERRHPGLRPRSLVDGVVRRLAARQPDPHPLQHDVRPRARPPDRGALRRRSHRHHLCDRLGLRLRGEFPGRRIPHVPAAHAERIAPDDRRLGGALWPDRRGAPLRPPRRQLHAACAGEAVGGRRPVVRLPHARHRQLGPPGRPGWRLPHVALARSADA